MNSTGVEITAGLGGFLVLFGLMLTVWFLGRDMTRRLRRMSMTEDLRRAEVRRQRAEREEQERARQDATEEAGGSGQDEQERAEAEPEEPGRQPDEDDPIG